MADNETQALQEELEQYRKEKERVREIVGRIGGTDSAKKDKIINIVFVVLLVGLFVFDLLRHILHIDINIPAALSLELGILFVSIKIIWMIYKQEKVEHFQFWILNSIEFRINDMNKKIRSIDKKIKSLEKD